MKLVHLSDLHLGKRVNEYSMLEDQKFILNQIVDILDEVNADAVLIAGDVYDKAVPSAEAVQLFDDFLVRLSNRKLHVFVVSGNHDSAERIAFGSKLMKSSRIYMSPVYDGHIAPISIDDPIGTVDFYMLPFVKPAHVRRFFESQEIASYTDAVGTAIAEMNINKNHRNVLITHQFVTGASRSESEEISVGGTDNVDAGVFEPFDYVALGHIHSPQNCGSERIRYCGTPLKYSFSEAKDQKSLTIVELEEKGELSISTIDLIPFRDMAELRGTYEQLMLKSFYEDTTWQEDYVHITLTDEEDIPDAVTKLRTVYHKLMKLDYDNARTRTTSEILGASGMERRSPTDLFADFYQLQNNRPMSEEQYEYMQALIERIWEANK